MAEEIVRLTKDDYDELIPLLNETFARARNREVNFEASLPKMCRRTNESMGKHIGIRVDGRLAAALGVYPLPAQVAGVDLLFSTVGNVATHPDFAGRGYMSVLLNEAMKELEAIGADGSRLGGKRDRYQRYGYDCAGWVTAYDLDIAQWPRKKEFKSIHFEEMTREDEGPLEWCRRLNQASLFHVRRDNLDDFFDTMRAWKHTPFAALDENGMLVGYLCASEDHQEIAEICYDSQETFEGMIHAWLQESQKLHICLMPHQIEENRFLTKYSASFAMQVPSQFKICNWEKMVGAFLRLKATYTAFPPAALLIEIEGYGQLLLETEGRMTRCIRGEKLNCKPDITVSEQEAHQLFFGPSPMLADLLGAGAILPLPLSWNNQDRV